MSNMPKNLQMEYALLQVHHILSMLNYDKGFRWVMLYQVFDDETIQRDVTEWQRTYHNLRTNTEYILIYDSEDNSLLYAVDITADSVLTAMKDLFTLLQDKF